MRSLAGVHHPSPCRTRHAVVEGAGGQPNNEISHRERLTSSPPAAGLRCATTSSIPYGPEIQSSRKLPTMSSLRYVRSGCSRSIGRSPLEVLPEHPILFLQVLDDVELLAVDPAGQGVWSKLASPEAVQATEITALTVRSSFWTIRGRSRLPRTRSPRGTRPARTTLGALNDRFTCLIQALAGAQVRGILRVDRRRTVPGHL